MGCVDCTLNRFGDIGGYLSYSNVGHHLKGVAFKSIRLTDSRRWQNSKIPPVCNTAFRALHRCGTSHYYYRVSEIRRISRGALSRSLFLWSSDDSFSFIRDLSGSIISVTITTTYSLLIAFI